MDYTVTVEVTFHPTAGAGSSSDLPRCEGVVGTAGGGRRAFSGWMDLLAALEQAATTGAVDPSR
jgi:hypothetical protein